jgi:hypothetical protein
MLREGLAFLFTDANTLIFILGQISDYFTAYLSLPEATDVELGVELPWG